MKKGILTAILLFGFTSMAAAEELVRPSLAELKTNAEAGDVMAQVELGLDYYGGSPETGRNMQEAIKWLTKAAEQGALEARFQLGSAYMDGFGVDKNYAEAAKWLQPGANEGVAVPQVLLGKMYAEGGPGMKRDLVEADFWLTLAAATDDYTLETKDKVERDMTPDQLAAVKKRVAEWKPVAPSSAEVETQKKFIAFAEAMHAKYRHAAPVSDREAASARSALERFTRTAAEGDWGSQERLGEYYASGENGVTVDNKEALFWMSLACNSDVENYRYYQCKEKLDAVRSRLTEAETKDVQARVDAWEPKPSTERFTVADIKPFLDKANRGDVRAMLELGQYYSRRESKAGRIDFPKAAQWYRKAADTGLEEAQQSLAELYKRDHSGLGRNNEEVYFWYGVLAKGGNFNSAGYAQVRDQMGERLRVEQIKQLDKRIADWKPVAATPLEPLTIPAPSEDESVDSLADDSLPTKQQEAYKLAQQHDYWSMAGIAQYYQGRNTPEGDAAAAKWLHKMAEWPDDGPGGDTTIANARGHYAALFVEGRGVPVDYVEAYMWLLLAQKDGSFADERRVDQVKAMLTPEQCAAAEKRADAWRPPPATYARMKALLDQATAGDFNAATDLARAFNAVGDYENAYFWGCRAPAGYADAPRIIQNALSHLAKEQRVALQKRLGAKCVVPESP